MSKVLIIRHLPNTLTIQEKEQLLKHFGAEKVWETKSKRNYVFASFLTVEEAKSSLIRLHQLEIAHRRLVVEYSRENQPWFSNKNIDETSSVVTKHIKEFLKTLNAWNPSVNFYQPPPVHLKYKYPDPTPEVFINIIQAMATNKQFYTQTLHLMNKMCLNSPFYGNEIAVSIFKDMFRNYFVDEISLPVQLSEPESEMSSDETYQNEPNTMLLKGFKRKHILAKTRKRPAAVLSTATLSVAKRKTTKQQDVFEEVKIHVPKKISVVVPNEMSQKQPDCILEVTGEIGKFQKEDIPSENTEGIISEPDTPAITKKELLQNRISYRDMKILPIFKNYHPGPPSMRLYIKNLAKTVTEHDVKRIYRRYIEKLPENQQQGFDVRVMQEGRMKGQCFVTFPSIEIAEQALNETNGFILKEKPMVVAFARAANKKTIDYFFIFFTFSY